MFFPAASWDAKLGEQSVPKSDPKSPEACATRKDEPDGYTYCMRAPLRDEFVFRDAKRAAAVYAAPKGPGLRLCRSCRAAYERENPKEPKS